MTQPIRQQTQRGCGVSSWCFVSLDHLSGGEGVAQIGQAWDCSVPGEVSRVTEPMKMGLHGHKAIGTTFDTDENRTVSLRVSRLAVGVGLVGNQGQIGR